MVTPLARQVINQILVHADKRTIYDPSQVMYRMADIHCFEVTEVIEEAGRLINTLEIAQKVAETSCFLPGPKTWIEWKNDNGHRVGCLLEDRKDYAHVIMVTETDTGIVSLPEVFGLPLVGGENVGSDILTCSGIAVHDRYMFGQVAAMLIGVLAFINTPRIIGRREHVAKRTLEKKILQTRKDIEIFPVNSWVEVILRVTAPKEMSASGTKEEHLTGEKALHFCRKHIRIQHGKLVYVKGHWRGNPELGIVNTRYKVTR